ncbi:sortase [Candidatus Woesebacteria bacterium]|nr:sortase [Candidatus Woesebacteria bacterium]
MPKKKPVVSRSELVKLYRNAVIHGITLESVEEKITEQLRRSTVTDTVEAGSDDERVKSWQLPLFIRLGALLLPISFIMFGAYLVGSAVLPIVSAFVWKNADVAMTQLRSPIPSEDVMEVTPFVVTQVQAQEETSYNTTPKIIDVELDYTNLSNWFDGSVAGQLNFAEQKNGAPKEFILDIPKINIKNASVAIGGTDLNKSLIAYPGTANPGEFGAPVVFGHSVLRQFYNPSEKNPRRYMSIFSMIMTLKTGDEIFVTYDGVKYTYVVQEKSEVKPTDVYILAQQYDSQRLKLVTCTPEGTYLRRGVVTAQLVSKQ